MFGYCGQKRARITIDASVMSKIESIKILLNQQPQTMAVECLLGSVHNLTPLVLVQVMLVGMQ